MSEAKKLRDILLAFVGAIFGGALGYFIFFYAVSQRLCAMVLPGALMGLGCGAMLGGKSNLVGVICGVCGLALGLFIEWQFAPFATDRSLGYFVTHIHQLRSMTLVLIAIGALLGFAFGRGRDGGIWPRREKAAAGE